MALTAGWDVQDAFYSRQQGALLEDEEDRANGLAMTVGTTAGAPEVNGLKASQVKQKFRQFILSFTTERYRFKYRERLTRAVNAGEFVLLVDFDDLQNFDAALASVVRSNPTNFLPMLYKAANEAAARLDNRHGNDTNETNQDTEPDRWAEHWEGEEIPAIQVLFSSTENARQIRDLQSSTISRMVRVTGIVTAASTNMLRATRVKLQCKGCSETISLDIKTGMGGVNVPMYCARQLADGETSDCPQNPYMVLPDQGEYTDQQSVKLQELPEQVPTGEMPRSIQLSLEKSLVGKAVPGMRISVIGVYSINNTAPGKAAKGAQGKTKLNIRTPFIRVVGLNVEDDAGGGGRALVSAFDADTEEEMNRIARTPNLYDIISKSIAPEIFGFDDIKKATAALLFGGSRKTLPDSMRIRGDINVLLLGDPSTAKSQMLKFAEKVAPISVYTSGKGSSAAGLTASVVRDAGAGGDFHLEGGAMVLADGGVVCIDEFDKMRLADRVAIHEAMEQQTISVAKAGITAVLNARSSVLAAANPAFGRYDDTRSASENIEFQSTILSRFDLIFIVRDIRSAERDSTIAKHVLGLHQRGGAVNLSASRSDDHIDINTLKKYIAFARSRSSPRLTPEAVEVLRNSYVTIRQEMREAEFGGGEAPQVPITVRQLEAIVRISESLAKMTLSPTATEQHVTEAIRLFKVATLESANTGGVQRLEGTMRPDFMAEVQACEDAIKRRLPVGSTASDRRMREDLRREGHNQAAVMKALEVMIIRQELEPRAQRKKIYRAR